MNGIIFLSIVVYVIFFFFPIVEAKEAVSLERFFQDVEARAPRLQLDKSKIEVATKSIEKASQLLNPTLTVGTWNGSAVNGQKWGQSDITIQQPVELFGKRSGRIAISEARSDIVQAQFNQSRAEIRTEAILFLHRLRQVLFEKMLIEEAHDTFEKLINVYKGRPQLTPEQTTSLFLFQMAKRDYDLRRNESENEIKSLEIALQKNSGYEIDEILKILPPKIKIWPDLQISEDVLSPEIAILQAEAELSRSELKFEKSQSWPTPSIGPSYTDQNQFGEQAKIWGIVFTSELPILSWNRGGRAAAFENVAVSEKNLSLQKSNLLLQKKNIYQQYSEQKKTLQLANIDEAIHKKHAKIENYFLKGLINSSLVIETHRQIVDTQKNYNSSELSALEKYYRLLLLDGKFFGGTLL